MYYLIHKFEHECLIEDVLEGDTLEQAVENAFKERKGGMILGNDVEESELSAKDMLEWILEDNYEFTTIYTSQSEINSVTV